MVQRPARSGRERDGSRATIHAEDPGDPAAEVGRSHREVAQSLSVGLGTMSDVMPRGRRAGLDWAQVQTLAEDTLEGRLCGPRATPAGRRPPPDCSYLLAVGHDHLLARWQSRPAYRRPPGCGNVLRISLASISSEPSATPRWGFLRVLGVLLCLVLSIPHFCGCRHSGPKAVQTNRRSASGGFRSGRLDRPHRAQTSVPSVSHQVGPPA
jgi:hypothetical protein